VFVFLLFSIISFKAIKENKEQDKAEMKRKNHYGNGQAGK
jgi:hypothetical protein